MATVLIVDDLAVNRELLLAILNHTGHRLIAAGNGAEALAAARRERPDLVITDVLMPTVDGFELVRQFRADPALAAVPVIFCTAYYREHEARRLAESCGVSDVLVKPCEPQAVLAAVAGAIGGQSAPVPAPPLTAEFDREHLRLVTDKLSAAVDEMRATNRRLEAVIDIGLQLATERNPSTLLDRCCAAARALFNAPYAALAVWDEKAPGGFRLSTAGVANDVAAAMTRELGRQRPFLDRGTGSFRSANPGSDPARLGLPDAHPPIGAIVAAPIASLARAYGWLYVAGSPGDPFSEDDERLLRILSGQVGRVYENGRLLYEAQHHADRLRAEIADRRRAEDALRKADEHMLFALAAGDVGLWDLNPATNEMTCSETFERIHGWPPRGFECRLEALYARVHPEDRSVVEEALAHLKTDGADAEVEYRVSWPDDSEHRIVLKGRVIPAPAAHETTIVGVAIDVTERRQLQAQLLQSQKMEAIGLLAGGVAHDFNNILTAILGYVELLEGRFEPGTRGMRDLEQIRKSGLRAAHLTRQLLAFSRRQVLRPVQVDLNALIKELTSMLRRLIGEDITLTLALEPELARVTADPGQIEQVIMNLVVNARDAMPRGGMLTITTAHVDVDGAFFRRLGVGAPHGPARMVRVSVSDTGIGMDAATRRRVFEPFFTTKPRGKGTGLGLATVYGIVKQSGGFIDLDTEPGRGATFHVLLPPVDRPATPAAESEVTIATVRGTETILLVEDDDSVRSLVRTLLEGQGYRVVDFADAETAAAAASPDASGIDLVLTDVVLPGLSGPELFERLRAVNPHVRVLYMSGHNDEKIVARGILAPDVPYLEKPFTGGRLMRKIREVLDSPSRPTP